MALNIKNPDAEKLTKELAQLTGETATKAVTEAVRERLERLRARRHVGLAGRLLKIADDCAAHLNEPAKSLDHAEVLNDEKGLPR
jgi:antitoxin VapB